MEYDSTNRASAEATRQAAWSLAEDAGNLEVMAWAQEMRAWFALTRGDYRGVLAAAQVGHDVAPHGAAAVQLHAQKAKAWARIGDRRQVEVSLEQGRTLLERLPHPENLDNHFAVDPAKWDFYSMDCYRLLGGLSDANSAENKLVESYATEVIRIGTDTSGVERAPMRNAEARVTLGVISARQGDLERALDFGPLASRPQCGAGGRAPCSGSPSGSPGRWSASSHARLNPRGSYPAQEQTAAITKEPRTRR